MKSTCESFPFDTQHCNIKFGSWTHDKATLNIDSTQFDISRYQMNLEWHLEKAESIRTEVDYEGIFYPDITFHLHFQRRSLFHILNLIFPIALITLLTITTFILPSESGERLSVAVTLMLATTVFMLLVAETIPESSESVPLVGVFFMICMVKMFVIIIALCVISRLYNRTKTDAPMGRWTRKYIFERLAYSLGARCKNHPRDSIVYGEDREGENGIALSKECCGEDVQKYTVEEEWRIVASTVDRFLFLFFIAFFVLPAAICSSTDRW